MGDTPHFAVTHPAASSRYYTITASGRRQLGQEISKFDELTLAIARVLGRGGQPGEA